MKLKGKALPVYRHGLFKILLAMKLTAIFMLASLVTVSAKTFSQSIKIHQNQISLDKVLKLINKHSGYSYLYVDDVVSRAIKVDVDVDNASVVETLNRCFKVQPLTYKIFEKTIVIKAKPQSVKAASVAIKVQGTVSDEKGLPLPGVSVKVKGTSVGAITDANGKYSLANVDGSATLVFSFIGYNTQEDA